MLILPLAKPTSMQEVFMLHGLCYNVEPPPPHSFFGPTWIVQLILNTHMYLCAMYRAASANGFYQVMNNI
jgi:hypothetical protein